MHEEKLLFQALFSLLLMQCSLLRKSLSYLSILSISLHENQHMYDAFCFPKKEPVVLYHCAMRHTIFFFFYIYIKYFLTRGSTICKTYRRVSRFFQFLAPFDNNLPDRLKLFKGRLPSFCYSQSSLSRSISVAFVT